MKRISFVVLLLLFTAATASAQFKRTCKPKPPCAATLADCKPEGCSKDKHHDPDLNTLKNRTSSPKPVEDKTLNEMIALESKVEKAHYRQGKPRNVLGDLGEGSQVRVVAYLLAVKQECGESCNCGLQDVDVTTDNHLVLVNPSRLQGQFKLPPNAIKKLLSKMFQKREPFSVTAEFTP